MFSRVYFGAHWISDTIAGVTIGAAITYLVVALEARIFAWLFLSHAGSLQPDVVSTAEAILKP